MNNELKFLKIYSYKVILEDLYSAGDKIIVSSEDRENFEKYIKLEVDLEIYQFKIDRDRAIGIVAPLSKEINLDGQKLTEITLTLNFCLGLLAFSATGKTELIQLQTWWSVNSNQSSIPQLIELYPDATTEISSEFWQQIYRAIKRENHSLARRMATLQRQYLALRTLHENMQNAFAIVEDYLSQAKLPPIQLAFEAQISEESIEPNKINNSNSAILQQLLPVSSKGLAVIKLYVAKSSPQAVGNLTVTVKASEDISEIALWQIPYAHLSPGWLSLDLPSIDLNRQRDVELTIEWATQLGFPPSLSLTKLQTIPEARAYNENIILERSLAMQIYRGLPGTRNVTSPYLLLNKNQTQPLPQLGYLGEGAIALVREVTPNLPTDDFEHIQLVAEGTKIMTHPRADGSPTIAMLPYCFPPTANRLTATIATEHPKAGTVEYAVAIITPDTDPKTALNSAIALKFSDWIAIEPNTPRQIALNLDSSVTEHCHIIIAAKLGTNCPIDFAWANWLNFQTEIAKIKSSQVSSGIIDPQLTPLRDASVTPSQFNFVKVQLVENNSKIQVHPSVEGDTVAIVSNAVTSGTVRVETTVCTENDTADAIAYAIAIIANDNDRAARLAVVSPSTALAFSGWHQIPANTPSQLKLDLVVPTVDTYHLVLATRLPATSSQANAWARWLKIESIAD